MTLSNEDANLFYSLFFPLLDYVNKKYSVNPKLREISGNEGIDICEAEIVTNYLWNNPNLINEYLKESTLSDEDFIIVHGWNRFVTEKFVLERNLQKGSVFISDKNEVYMVSGIFSSFEDIFYGVPLPIIMQATLIPFKDKIITDGIVSVYNVHFGRNVSVTFKETYLTAKKDKTIHTSL